MNLLFFSDLHAHNWEQFATQLPNGRNSRLQIALDVVAQIRDYCRDQKVDAAFFLGDMFESRRSLDIDVWHSTYQAFRDLSEAVESLFILKGNHDEHTKIGDVHSLEAFKPFATLIDEPYVGSLVSSDGHVSFAAHPHTIDAEAFRKFSKGIHGCDLFLFHQPLKEACVGSRAVSIRTQLGIEDLPTSQVRLCIGGDIHTTQLIATKVLYCGSLYQQDFGEANDQKGFYVTDTSEWTPSKTPVHFIESKAPKFRLYDSPGNLTRDLDSSGLDPEYDFLHCTCGSLLEEAELKEKHPRVRTELKRTQAEVKSRIDVEIASDDRKLLQTWIKANNPGLEERRLLEDGLELLNEKV